MNPFLLFGLGLILINPSKNESNKLTTNTTTTFYLVRHAEKDLSDKTNRDPKLTAKGTERAKNIATVLSQVDINAVYSTNYTRTIETAKPTATLFDKEIIIYDWKTLDIEKLINENTGKNVLIVGHSNSTPIIANKLLGENKYSELDESVYSNLYIVTINSDSRSSILLKIN